MIVRKSMIPIILVTHLLFGCNYESEQSSSTKQIIGNDQRQTVNDPYLMKNIGTLVGPNGRCTAFVSGSDEITTASHCIVDDELKAYSFYPADLKREAKIIEVLQNDRKNDVTTLRTDSPWPSSLTKAKLDPTKDVSVVAIDQKSRTLKADKTKIEAVSSLGLITHLADTLPGASGAPIIQDNRVVGVHLGARPKAKTNIGVTNDAKITEDFSKWLDNDFVQETSCNTNCSNSCEVCTPFGCTVNPVCKANCELERVYKCNKTVKCIVDGYIAARAADACATCLYGLGTFTAGSAIAACGGVCLVTAVTMQRAYNSCK